MIALNHSFLFGIAHATPPRGLDALTLIEHLRRRTGELPRVHETLYEVETGAGQLLGWANHQRNDPDVGLLVELLLRMVSGPFLPEERLDCPIDPPLTGLDEWLVDLFHRLFATANDNLLSGLVSPAPRGGADALEYRAAERAITNWLDEASFDRELTTRASGNTIDVLREAEQQMGGRLIVLPSAIRSAEAWALDCAPAELARALLGLEHYAAALASRGADGRRLSREESAARYHEQTTIPMSQETGATSRNPARRRQRTFNAAPHGMQYFDMHAKPGTLTRVHVWTPPRDEDGDHDATPIYIGHCGEHLK